VANEDGRGDKRLLGYVVVKRERRLQN